MTIKYVFNEDRPLVLKNAKDADAQRIGEALARISNANGGRMTPKVVVEAARARNHVLHKHFEWNNDVAADHYRNDQARRIINCVRIISDERPTPAFISVADKGGVTYRSLGEVLRSPELQLAVLKRAERDLDAFTVRYRELTDICDLVSTAKAKTAEMRARLENRAQ
jgi:hypothetical protein